MDIDETRQEESHIVVRKLMDSAGGRFLAGLPAIPTSGGATGCGFRGGR